MDDNIPSLYIDGSWQYGEGPTLTSTNPADGKILWCRQTAAPSQIDHAIDAAKRAFPLWSSLTQGDRWSHLCRTRELIKERASSLATLIAEESGKPLWEAKSEVDAVIGKFDISAAAYDERCRQWTVPLPHATAVVRHKAHGVMAVLGPFNLPAHLPHGHIIPALLAGNTVVFKPSELTPSVGEAMVRCWHDSGLPHGVLNLLQGGKEVGTALVAAAPLAGILFTGSWQTGEKLVSASSCYPSRILALEMGGNNPLVVWDCRDHHAAAYITILSAFITAGQRCSCARRLIIAANGDGDAFVNELVALTERLVVGSYDATPPPFMGPLIQVDAADRVYSSYQRLLKQGARPLLPMSHTDNSAFLSPSIVDVTALPSHDDEEIFGPLLQLFRVSSFDDAVDIANKTAYGLSAGILTDVVAHYGTFWREVHAGVINWNTPLTGMTSRVPFGGVGLSGNWRPSAYYAADYSAYPVASVELPYVQLPSSLPPGLPTP